MEYKLAIDSSAMQPTVAIFEDDNLIYNSQRDYQNQEDAVQEKDVCKIIDAGFTNIGMTASELVAILVCRGPGALNSTRAGVAIANSLGYSLGIPVFSFTSFQLIKQNTSAIKELPLLITIRAANNHCYSCIFKHDESPIIGYGPVKDLIATVAQEYQQVAVAGSHNEKILEALGDSKALATDVTSGQAKDVLKITSMLMDNTYPKAVVPLTEQSPEFAQC